MQPVHVAKRPETNFNSKKFREEAENTNPTLKTVNKAGFPFYRVTFQAGGKYIFFGQQGDIFSNTKDLEHT